MSIATMSRRLLSTVVPTVEAGANCGRCEARPLSTCCRANYRRIAYVDYCENVCFYRCEHAPKYC